VWNETYQQPAPDGDPAFNTAGWNSSYTGLPIPSQEMREWVDHGVERVLSLRPKRVMEIGCGSELLLSRIAPKCASYFATDYSEVSIDGLRGRLEAAGAEFMNVHLERRAAHQFDGIRPGSFDTVVINSVVQYFPDIYYLIGVLEQAVKVVAPEGSIFIGDLRSLPLLQAFHTAVELHRAPSSLSCSEFQERVLDGMGRDPELVIDPSFFFALNERLPEVNGVEIQLKRGRHHNELTRFRYDVILRVGPEREGRSPRQVDWQEAVLSIADIRRLLKEDGAEPLLITRVPNARIQAEIRAVEMLSSSQRPVTVGDLIAATRQDPLSGIDPEDLWWLSGQHRVRIGWSASGSDGCFDVLFERGDPASFPFAAGTASASEKGWEHYANHPWHARYAADLGTRLGSFLMEKLPAYMVPSTIQILGSLPLTPNQKLDRTALPRPNFTRPEATEPFVAPRCVVEEVLAGTWAKLLGSESVGANDNFFRLGGHSLLAVQLLSRVRDTFGVELPLRAIFEAPTLAGMANALISYEATPGQTKRIAAILKQVDSMSGPGGHENQHELEMDRGVA